MESHITITQVPIDELHAAPQVRETFDHESLLALAATLKTVGIRQPINARRVGNRLLIIAGERRWRAAKLAGLEIVPVLIEDRELSEAEILELQLIENCAREDLNPVEKAKAYDRWMKATNGTAAELARRTGTSAGSVSKITSLLLLAPVILDQVQRGNIPYSSAYELAKVGDAAEQGRLAQEVVAGRLTRDKLCEQSKAKNSRRPERPRQPRRPAARLAVPLDDGRTVSVPMREAVTFDRFIAWIEQVLNCAKELHAKGLGLPEAVKALASQSR